MRKFMPVCISEDTEVKNPFNVLNEFSKIAFKHGLQFLSSFDKGVLKGFLIYNKDDEDINTVIEQTVAEVNRKTIKKYSCYVLLPKYQVKKSMNSKSSKTGLALNLNSKILIMNENDL